MTTRSELEQVKRVHGARLDAGDVAERLDQLFAIDLRVIDDQRPTALTVPTVAQLALAGTNLARSLNLGQISTRTQGL